MENDVATVSDDPGVMSSEAATVSRGRERRIVAVLALIALLAAIDRQAFSVMLVPIQNELHVSDAAMGLLTGSAFAVIYAFVAIPFGVLADRINRRNLIAGAVAVWSLLTVASGLVRGFFPLLFVRVGVGAAEAAPGPATLSLIADVAPHHRRGVLFSFLAAGAAFGFAVGGLIAGAISDRWGWRLALLVVGLPGLLVALVTRLTVPEPVRGAHDGPKVSGVGGGSLKQAIATCLAIPTFGPYAAAYTIFTFGQGGWLIWTPVFLMRVHHLTGTQMGAAFGVIVAIGVLSVLATGPLTDWLAKRGPRWRVYITLASLAISVPALTLSSLASDLRAAIGFQFLYALANACNSANVPATYMSFAPPRIRGLMSALMNIIGAGLGGGLSGVAYGAINDALHKTYGAGSLHYTMLLTPATMVLAAGFFLIASRRIDADVLAITAPANVTSLRA